MKLNQSLKILGQRIRQSRKSLGISQEELALSAGIDRSYMGQVERGERNISIVSLCKISLVLKKDLGFLCAGLPEGSESDQEKIS